MEVIRVEVVHPKDGGLERLHSCGVDDVIEAGAPPSEFVAAVAALAESTGARFEAEFGVVAPAEVPPERPAAALPTP